jgi:hypothetical protein
VCVSVFSICSRCSLSLSLRVDRSKRYKTVITAPNQEAIQKAVDRHAAIVNEAYEAKAYSDPQCILHLHIPSIHSHLPVDRFRLDGELFAFMGRTKFATLLKTLGDVYTQAGVMSLDVYGTVGSGKVSLGM